MNQEWADNLIKILEEGQEVAVASSLRCPTCSERTRRIRFEHSAAGTTIDLIHADDRVQRLGEILPDTTMVCLASGPEHALGAGRRWRLIEPKSVDETENV